MKKHIVAGILAHVDAGKTTLSEALLYRSGQIRRLGRVDHGDAFLDTDAMERARGITIFAEPAIIRSGDLTITLIDTPGHVDFSAETERVLAVLDYAILVVSGADGIQGHTETLWRLLRRYNVPTFIFVNKMDAPGADRAALLAQLRDRFSDGCVDFENGAPTRSMEDIAMLDESAMNEFLDSGAVADKRLKAMISARSLFPVFFGSALAMEGIDGLRLYSGAKFTTVDALPAGSVCAVTGLTHSRPGQGLGDQCDADAPVLQPVLTYTLLPQGEDPHRCLTALRELDDEDPLLHVVWQERLQEIHVQLMGAVQLEIIQQIMRDRFNLNVGFGPGSILYKETIAHAVEGIGHFEPLRHYAEAHVLLEPGEPGSGLTFATSCSEDVLARNWQRLILTHFAEKEHLGVLIGVPITDMKLTLLTGRAHEKHTEGGDFRQATYRAIRQGLMTALVEGDFSRHDLFDEDAAEDVAEDAAAADAKTARTDESEPSDGSAFASAAARDPGWCRVLEPWYRFRLDIPQDMLGRAMSDIQRMSGTFDPPEMDGQYAVLAGVCPVSEMRDYAMDVNVYTHGTGHLGCVFDGYRPCHNAAEVIEQAGYDPGDDLENTPDSVFCAHGAGYTVKWYRVPDFMHLDRAYDAGQ